MIRNAIMTLAGVSLLSFAASTECFAASAETTNPLETNPFISDSIGLHYVAQAYGGFSTSGTTPFWLSANRYGVVPVESGNTYFRAAGFYNGTFGRSGDFRWGAGADLLAVYPRYKNVYTQQLYAQIGWKKGLLTVGSKEQPSTFLNNNLSSGDICESNNARPIPGIRLELDEYVTIPFTKGWLSFKGFMTVGKSMDKAYLKDFSAGTGQNYINDVLWHTKSGTLRIKDTEGGKPFWAEIGLFHGAQWGGTSTNPALGKQPSSFKDFLRIFMGKEGGEGSSDRDKLNTLGNHYGKYQIKLGYEHRLFDIEGYIQHFFDDKSGMELANWKDGLFGIEVKPKNLPWLKAVVFEYFNTRDQSGPIHFIEYDRPARGGGVDDYYNNLEYFTGLSYFGQTIGNPLIISPINNTDHTLMFKNNRVKAFNLGAEGFILPELTYIVKISHIKGYGTHNSPFANRNYGFSGMVAVQYSPELFAGWSAGCRLGLDHGTWIGNQFGAAFTITKSGTIFK